MNLLDAFTFEIRDVRSGELVRVLSDVDVARVTGADVVDVGAALEWYSEIGVPDAFEPQFIVKRIPITGRA